MYNEEIKQRYLDESIDRNYSLDVLGSRAFKQIENYEIELNKDCCCFTINEIILYYQRRASTSIDSLNTLNSILRGYTNWCLLNHMVDDNQNHYDEINQDILTNCLNYGIVNDKIISRKDLIYQLDLEMIENVSDQALLLAIFEGICGENMSELVHLNCDDIELKDDKYLAHLYSGRILEISKRLYDLCKKSQDCYVLTSYNIAGKIQKALNEEDRGVFKMLKAVNVTTINRKSLYNKLVKAKKYMGLNYLTTYSLLESGRIDMVKRLMEEEGKTLEQTLTDERVVYRYGKLPSIIAWKRKYEEYV